MASSSSEKSRGGVLSCVCWLLGACLKVSTLVVLLALLATVHQLRTAADDSSLQLALAEQDVQAATSQQKEATKAYTDAVAQVNQLQTELADTRREAQDLQVKLSKKQEVQKELDRASQEAKTEKQKALVLSQRVQELEADIRRKEQEQKQDQVAASAVEALESEKQQLQKKVKELEASVEQLRSTGAAAEEKQKALTQELQQTQGKLTQAEKLKEMLSAKETAQDKKIEELRAQVNNLEGAKKVAEATTETLDLTVQELTAQLDAALRSLAAARAQVDQNVAGKLPEAEAARARLEQSPTPDIPQLLNQNMALTVEKNQLLKQLEDLAAVARELQDAPSSNCLQLVAQEKLSAQRLLEETKRIAEAARSDAETAMRHLTEEIDERDKQVADTTKQAGTFRSNWMACDKAAKEQTSALQSQLAECQSRAAPAQPPAAAPTDCSAAVAREKAEQLQEFEQERRTYKKEKKNLEGVMRDMLQDLDGRDSRIREMEKTASAGHKLAEVQKTSAEKVATLKSKLRACLSSDAESCTAAGSPGTCSDGADAKLLKVIIMDLEASLEDSKNEQQKLMTSLQKTQSDWGAANEYADQLREQLKEAEQTVQSREHMVDSMREQAMRCAEVTHEEIVQEVRALANEHDKLLRKYNEETKQLEEKMEKARKGWLENDKELKGLRKELEREKLRAALCQSAGQK